MSHINLHLAEGLAIGTAATIIPVGRAWLADRPVSGQLGRMAIAAFACAAWAAMPALLVRLGLATRHVHRAAWTNVFFGHAFLQRRIYGGLFLGEVAIAAWLVGFYLLLLLAIRRAHRRQRDREPRRE